MSDRYPVENALIGVALSVIGFLAALFAAEVQTPVGWTTADVDTVVIGATFVAGVGQYLLWQAFGRAILDLLLSVSGMQETARGDQWVSVGASLFAAYFSYDVSVTSAKAIELQWLMVVLWLLIGALNAPVTHDALDRLAGRLSSTEGSA